MRCMIIDDEPAARDILNEYIGNTPELELVGVCKDALEARKQLKEQSVDLLFLDINLPRLSGIELLKSLTHPPKVILTTAYLEYALEGYELDVTDYLLKPFSFQRFLKAVNKVSAQQQHKEAGGDEHITVKADGKLYRLGFDDIVLAESQGDYIALYTTEKKITFYQTMKELDQQLPDHLFCRVHKSYIVSLKKIEYLEGNMIRMGDHSVPVGKAYKEAFMQKYTA